MKMRLIIAGNLKYFSANRIIAARFFSTTKNEEKHTSKFETVFTFPTIRYISLINRLKVYHIIGSSVAIPSTAVLGMMNLLSSDYFFTTSYIGITGAIVMSLATMPFSNVIGHLYINKDNSEIKISSLDFWGRRKDKIVPVDDWIPLLDMKHKSTDALYLTPQLKDGTTYKLPVKFGKVLNAQKIGQVLE